MMHRTWRRGVVVSLAAGLLATSAGYASASASQTTAKSTGMSSGATRARLARRPMTTSLGMLSLVAGRRVYHLRPGPALSASLASPSGVALDVHGNLFIADTYNNVVEEVTPAGRLSVVAGVAGKCGKPTPGPATKSDLGNPSGVAVDVHGNLFIADTYNNVVEEVTPAGRLSVVAGVAGREGRQRPGPATSSDLNGPGGVALDAHGDLFIADTYNDVVEEVTRAGTLSVVAGNGKKGPPTPGPATESELDSPTGVALDAHGDLFIADTDNDVVEEVTPAGRLSVVAGVTDKSGGPSAGPATSSDLNSPAGLAVDAHGNLFIADASNNVVEEVTPTGTLLVVVGNDNLGPPGPGPARGTALGVPTGVALDAHGDLFIADTWNGVVEKVTPTGTLSVVAGIDNEEGPPAPGPATKSSIGVPSGVAVDAHGNLFIADRNNLVGQKVTPTGRLSVVAGIVGSEDSPTPGPATKSRLGVPTGVAVDALGDLFIADLWNDVVEEVTPAGNLSVVAGNETGGPPTPGPATKSSLDAPSGVAVDAHGDLFIADAANYVVEEVTPAGRLSVVAGNG